MSKMLQNNDLLTLNNITHIYNQTQKIKVLNNVNIKVLGVK